MSSIYDALKRVQNNSQGPEYVPVPASAMHKGRVGVIVIAAIIASSLATAAVYGLLSDGKANNAPGIVKAKISPENVAPVKRQISPPVMNVPRPLAAQTPAPVPVQGAQANVSPDQLFASAQSMQKAGNTLAAIDLYQRALHMEPKRNKDAYVHLGTLLFEQKKYDKAIHTYRTALTYFSKDAVILNNMGGVLLAKGDTDGAIDFFKSASNGARDYVEPVYNLACAYAKKGDIPAAKTALKKAMRMHPDVKVWAENDPDLEILNAKTPVREQEKGEK